MKKIFIALTCVLMFSQVSFAECNIAVVDLQKVVDNSAQVKTLKNEHTAKIKELNGIITKAQEEIAKQTDTKKIVEIQDKYTNQFNNKKSEIDKIYSSKLANIETQIKSEIEKKAKADGYDLVLSKGIVLFGGNDITSEIIKVVK